MKISVVIPPRFRKKTVVRGSRCQKVAKNVIWTPDWILPALSYTRDRMKLPKENFSILDCNARNLNFIHIREFLKKQNPSIVIFQACHNTIDYDIEVAKIAKSISKTCRCYIHEPIFSPARPDYIFKNSNFTINGILPLEFETTLLSIAQDKPLEEQPGLIYFDSTMDRVKRNPVELIDNLDEIPCEDYGLLGNDWPRYYNTVNLRTARGCPFKCEYCHLGENILGPSIHKPRYFSPERVAYQFRNLQNYEIENAWINDETFIINEQRTSEIVRLLIQQKNKVNYHIESRFSTIHHPKEIASLLAKSRCASASFGLESVDDYYGKVESWENTKYMIDEFKKHHIEVGIWLIFNLPGQTRSQLYEMLDRVVYLKPDLAEVVFASPFIGTEFYEKCKKEKLFVFSENIMPKIASYGTAYLIKSLPEFILRETIREYRNRSFKEYLKDLKRIIKKKDIHKVVLHLKKMRAQIKQRFSLNGIVNDEIVSLHF